MYIKHAHGFTLIEIMVVVTVSMVLVGLGLAQYNEFRQKQELIRSAENFATELREVQKRADIGQRVGCNNGNAGISGLAELVGYRVEYKASEGQILKVYELCDDNDSTPESPKKLASRPIYLRDHIELVDNNSIPLSEWDLQFNALSPQVESEGKTLMLRNTQNNMCVEVVVSQLGDVSVNESMLGICPI